MKGWRLRSAEHVVEIIYEDDAGNIMVGATACRPVTARRFLRYLERECPEGPPRTNGDRRRRLSPVQREVIARLAQPGRFISWDGKTPGYLFPGGYKVAAATLTTLRSRQLIYAVSDFDDAYGDIRDYQLTQSGRREAASCRSSGATAAVS